MVLSLPILLLTLAAAPAQRVPVLPLTPGDGVSANTADAMTQALAAELRQRPGLEVVTANDLTTVLGMARQRELLGCEADRCRAEIGNALEADVMVTGQLSRLGESWLFTVQLLDGRTATTLGQSMRRQKGGSVDGLLDGLAEMARELFPQGGATAKAVKATGSDRKDAVVVAASSQAPAALPPSWAVKALPADKKVESTRLVFATDGKGRYFAADPQSLYDLFSGQKGELALQRVFGGGSDGKGGFSQSFWDPRAKGNASLERKDGKFTLTCGEKSVALKPVGAAETKRLIKSVKLRDTLWQRQGHGLARDEDGVYYYVDRAREKDTTDYRVYVGVRGKVTGYPAELLVSDAAGELWSFGGSKLMISERSQTAEVRTGESVRKLIHLQTGDHAHFIYTQLGAYKAEPLGTACDGLF